MFPSLWIERNNRTGQQLLWTHLDPPRTTQTTQTHSYPLKPNFILLSPLKPIQTQSNPLKPTWTNLTHLDTLRPTQTHSSPLKPATRTHSDLFWPNWTQWDPLESTQVYGLDPFEPTNPDGCDFLCEYPWGWTWVALDALCNTDCQLKMLSE